MNKLYAKNELSFSLIWIALYVVLFSVAENLSELIGISKIITVPICILFVLFLWSWIRKNNLKEKYGLCKFQGNAKGYLYFIPLVFLASCNLWNGVTLRLSPIESVLHVISMLCVGFIEEILFRGFLFKALCCEKKLRQAILISSLTFGLGHIVNLLNGAELFSTLLQICYAVAIGFLFTIIFYKGKSLIPCILTHSLINSLSAFSVTPAPSYEIVSSVILAVVSVGYAVWIIILHPSNSHKAYISIKQKP